MTEGLFDVAELAAPARAGRAEASLHRALAAAVRDGAVIDVDAGMAAAALVGARALDRAEALPDKSAVYAIAQLLPPYQKALHALRLPAEVAPVGAARAPAPDKAPDNPAQWLGDAFGAA